VARTPFEWFRSDRLPPPGFLLGWNALPGRFHAGIDGSEYAGILAGPPAIRTEKAPGKELVDSCEHLAGNLNQSGPDRLWYRLFSFSVKTAHQIFDRFANVVPWNAKRITDQHQRFTRDL
jgi:hypothetical protein